MNLRIIMMDYAGGHVLNAGLRGEVYGEQQIADVVSLFRDVGFDTIWFRTSFCGKVCYHSKVMQPFDGEYRLAVNNPLKEIMSCFDPLEVVIREARRRGLKVLCWITPMDNYYPGLEDPVLARNPRWLLQSRDGRHAMRGVPCLACTEYVDLRIAEVREVMDYGCDGVYHAWGTHTVDTAVASDPQDLPNNFGWNQPILDAYDAKHGKPIGDEDYDPDRLYEIHADFLDEFVRRSAQAVHEKRGQYVTISTSGVLTSDDHSYYTYRPSGAKVFRLPSHWRKWAEEGWIDRIVAGADGRWLRENEKAAPFPVPAIGLAHAAWAGDPHHPEMADVADGDLLATAHRCLNGPFRGIAIQESDSIEAANQALWSKLKAAWSGRARSMKRKIGLFSGGIETYWKDSGMEQLPLLLDRDAMRVAETLGKQFEVIYPGIASCTEQAIARARAIRAAGAEAVVMYHATYVDDAMSLAVLDEMGPDIFPIHLHSQGIRGIPEQENLLEAGTAWGNNSSVQLCGTLKRMRPDLHLGYVFGAIDNPAVYEEISQYVRAWRCVRDLKGSRIRYLPHRCACVPMYDTFPDDTMMMAQTGVAIGFLTTVQLMDEMDAVTEAQTNELVRDITSRCDVIEPTEDEVRLACRLAIALRRLVEKHKVNALAIEIAPEIMIRTGMLPSLGMALLIDQGVVVATEGDLGVSVGGLMLRSLSGKPVHFWEHLMFDEEANWVLGGHEGGSAGLSMARKGTRPKLRSTQYVDFRHMPQTSLHGVLPEFITEPGPVTIVNLFRGREGYEMRIATGRSVDTPPRPVHFEHTIVEPDAPLKEYFTRMKEVGVCHHFGLVHGAVAPELEKVARMLRMPCVRLTDRPL